MKDFAEMINSTKDWKVEFYDIIEENGWTDETGETFGICNDGKQRLVFNEDCKAVLADM